MMSNSARVNTVPVGLCGLQRRNAARRLRLLARWNASSRACASRRWDSVSGALQDLAAGVVDEREELRVGRRVDDDRVARIGDELEDFHDAAHHVGYDRSSLGGDVGPVPSVGGELRHRVGVFVACRISGVASPDRVGYRAEDRLFGWDVHFSDPQG
jgi:hypothetical protein